LPLALRSPRGPVKANLVLGIELEQGRVTPSALS